MKRPYPGLRETKFLLNTLSENMSLYEGSASQQYKQELKTAYEDTLELNRYIDYLEIKNQSILSKIINRFKRNNV
jgi:hypothetical protein